HLLHEHGVAQPIDPRQVIGRPRDRDFERHGLLRDLGYLCSTLSYESAPRTEVPAMPDARPPSISTHVLDTDAGTGRRWVARCARLSARRAQQARNALVRRSALPPAR